MKLRFAVLLLIISTLCSCVVKYANYVNPEGEGLATLNIKNVGTWYVTAISFAEPNGCTGRTWLGPGVVDTGTDITIKLKPNEVFSFQSGSAKGSVGSGSGGLTSVIESCGGGSQRFIPRKNGRYEMVVGLITEKNQCIYSFKEIIAGKETDIDSLMPNKVVIPQWANSPMCEKFE
ncbi:hypothetical protein [Agaribacter marinus]|uniref:Lipoprotein n=1 Tax=Agaribacter marinus TaxID=1431249 RepID=A0AA37WFN6_9ALTE|nr:hypothetical protein [Agaribacter marinus]GLR69181.1 hypothetical protein GCM10007852_00890 [Agaribacter marinus]